MGFEHTYAELGDFFDEHLCFEVFELESTILMVSVSEAVLPCYIVAHG